MSSPRWSLTGGQTTLRQLGGLTGQGSWSVGVIQVLCCVGGWDASSSVGTNVRETTGSCVSGQYVAHGFLGTGWRSPILKAVVVAMARGGFSQCGESEADGRQSSCPRKRAEAAVGWEGRVLSQASPGASDSVVLLCFPFHFTLRSN